VVPRRRRGRAGRASDRPRSAGQGPADLPGLWLSAAHMTATSPSGSQGALRSGGGLVSSSQEKMLPSHPTDANCLGIVRNVGCIGVITPSSRA
jgi:hypothetical protein